MTNQLNLRSIDIPQLARFGVGFDRMFDHLDEILRTNTQLNANYPPYNMIRHSEDRYSIEIAVAGFKQGEISLELNQDQISITGKQAEIIDPDKEYIHRGISGRDFVRTFTLAEHVEVIGAHQENGILTVDLERRIPEAKKPKTIDIKFIK